MDFRTIDASSVRWSLWTRGQPVGRTPGGAKIQVQTPLCPCSVTPAGAGMFRVNLKLSRVVEAHDAFATWIGNVEESAAEASELLAGRGALRRSECVYNNSMRLMAFSDTLAFDDDGKLSGDLMDAAGCAALIELQGLWTAGGKWGLRWRVVQLKFTKVAPDLPVCIVDEEAAAAPRHEAFAFADDP